MKKKVTKTIPIPGTEKTLGGNDVFIIAEIGKGFIQTQEDQPIEVYLRNAKKLIDEAVLAGADAVKFQTHEVEDEQANIPVVSPHFKGADRHAWVKRNSNATPQPFWEELKAYADKKGIIFFSTAMSRKAAEKLLKIDVPLWKIGSGDVEDFVMLDHIASSGKPVIFSTGMVSFDELDKVVNYLRGKVPLSILYCVSEYPCPPEKFNLSTLEVLQEKYPDVVIGFSDHSVGDHTVDLAAIKLGARVIEKHFSLSRDLWGSDHKVSMTPEELKKMVKDIRSGAHKKVDHTPFYGKKDRELEGANNRFRPYFKKALVAARDIKKGEKITKDMVYAMRPLMHLPGLPSHHFPNIVGKEVKKSLKKYDPISEDCV